MAESCNEDQTKLFQLIKDILTSTTVIEETIAEKGSKKNPVADNIDTANKPVDLQPHDINVLAGKVQELILNNQVFKNEIKELISESKEEMKQVVNSEISNLKAELNEIQEKQEAEQYSRRNCLLFHGIPESENESTDELVQTFLMQNFEIHISHYDLDRSHRLKTSRPSKYPWPIIVKFLQHNLKNFIYSQKNLLHKTGYLITESLTKKRLGIIS